MLAAAVDHKRGQGGVQALFVFEFLHRCFCRRPRVPVNHAGISHATSWSRGNPDAAQSLGRLRSQSPRVKRWRGKSEALERKVQGREIKPAQAAGRNLRTLEKLG